MAAKAKSSAPKRRRGRPVEHVPGTRAALNLKLDREVIKKLKLQALHRDLLPSEWVTELINREPLAPGDR